jgi:hypothetical protein
VQQLNDEIIASMRATFSTRPGQVTLLWLLKECGTFNIIPADETAVALKNLSLSILMALGGGGITEECVRDFAMNICSQPIVKKGDAERD